MQESPFLSLSQDKVINCAESALGARCTNMCRQLNSYINRVYELELEDGNFIIAKFYRPGRWSFEALQDEHDFLGDLDQQEIPVIAPMTLQDGKTLGTLADTHFAIYHRKGGRSLDEFSDDQWLELGRLLGRVHATGATRMPKDRITIGPLTSTKQHVEYILKSNTIQPQFQDQFQKITNTLIDAVTPLFADAKNIRIHGDCHYANLIYRPEESFYVIDFDDMSVGPPIQDLWMLLPDYMENSHIEIDLFLEGYETFYEFDRRTIALIEPLRAMRYIHYAAWCAHQVVEDGSSQIIPDFGTHNYWQNEINDLTHQLTRIENQRMPMGNF